MDAIAAAASLLAAIWWMSAAIKTQYSQDPKKSEAEREELERLAIDRNIRAACSAAAAAFAVFMKYLFSAFQALGMIS